MAVSALAKKLGIQPDMRILILHPPQGYKAMLDPLPPGVDMALGGGGPFDLVQGFFRSQAEVQQGALAAIQAVRPGGKVWLCYPKKSSKTKSDLSRDAGWDVVRSAGWEGVAMISVDDTWSAIRFRPQGEGKARRG